MLRNNTNVEFTKKKRFKFFSTKLRKSIGKIEYLRFETITKLKHLSHPSPILRLKKIYIACHRC